MPLPLLSLTNFNIIPEGDKKLMSNIKRTLPIITVVFIMLFFPSVGKSGECDVKNIVFKPSSETVDQQNWFKRGQSAFTIQIIGNGFCSGKTLSNVALSNTHGVNNNVEALNDVNLKFSDGSNEIILHFKAGEEGCTAFLGKADCHLELYFETPAAKDGRWSGGNYALLLAGFKHGKLKYECDQRFSVCNNKLLFEMLKIEGGEIVNE